LASILRLLSIASKRISDREENNVMKRLIFTVVLLCCSQVALAEDACQFMNGTTISLVANGFQAITGTIKFFQNTQSFMTAITFKGYAPDPIAGTCKNGHLTFTRTHSGPGGFVQTYDGSATDFTQETINGTYSNGSVDHSWSGFVVWSFPSSDSTKSPSSSLTAFEISTCQQKCFNDFAVEKRVGSEVLVCRKECLDCKKKCH
jgi:hypothetical protein